MWKFGLFLAAAVVAAPLTASAQTTALPYGISVSVTATAHTSDVVETFEVGIPLTARGEVADAQAALAKLRTALGANASVEDLGYSTNLKTAATEEHASIAVAPSRYAAAVKAAKSANAVPTEHPVTIAARDPEALEREALASATKLARARAETIAAADGRHIGKLLNVTPSAGEIGRDIAGSAMSGLVGPLNAMIASRLGQSASTSVEASAAAGGLYTFELLP